MMHDRHREPRALRHARAVRLWRLRQVLRTIPRSASPAQRAVWRLYAAQMVATHGRRTLVRVVWPWQPRPTGATAGRGRLTNPTAHC